MGPCPLLPLLQLISEMKMNLLIPRRTRRVTLTNPLLIVHSHTNGIIDLMWPLLNLKNFLKGKMRANDKFIFIHFGDETTCTFSSP